MKTAQPLPAVPNPAEDDIAFRVARSRAQQGLPPKVEDPAALAVIATILRHADDRKAHDQPATEKQAA